MIYLILPCGSNFGWGICGKYLVKELCDLCEATLITEQFDAGESGHKDIINPFNSIIIKKVKPLNINSEGILQAVWDDPDLEETIAHLEAAYQNRDTLKLIGDRAGADLSQITWKKTAEKFHRLLVNQGV